VREAKRGEHLTCVGLRLVIVIVAVAVAVVVVVVVAVLLPLCVEEPLENVKRHAHQRWLGLALSRGSRGGGGGNRAGAPLFDAHEVLEDVFCAAAVNGTPPQRAPLLTSESRRTHTAAAAAAAAARGLHGLDGAKEENGDARVVGQ
jgi:hypothetical protein